MKKEEHPPAKKLLNYLSGKTDEKEQDEISRHLSSCALCRIALSTVEDKVENKLREEAERQEEEIRRRMKTFMLGTPGKEEKQE